MAKRDKNKTVFWGIRDFPEVVKDEFMGTCKARGKDWKDALEVLMKNHVRQMKGERT